VEFMTYLTEAGYCGPLSLEIFNDVFRETDPSISAADGLRSLRWIQQGARGRLSTDNPARNQLAAMPKIDTIELIDHIEVSTDAPDECGALLGEIGRASCRQSRALRRGGTPARDRHWQ